MGGIGAPELLIVFLVVLVVFGPRKIPEVARGVGRGLREFRRLSVEFQRELNVAEALEEKQKPSPPRGPTPAPPPPTPHSTGRDRPIDRPADRPTDGPADRPTD